MLSVEFVDDMQDERFSSDSELTTAPPPSSRAWTLEEMPAKAKVTMLMTTFIMDFITIFFCAARDVNCSSRALGERMKEVRFMRGYDGQERETKHTTDESERDVSLCPH